MKKLLLFLFIFVGINSYGQLNIPEYIGEVKYDTVKVEFLISDTSHWFDTRIKWLTHKEAGCLDSTKQHYFFHAVEIKVDGGRRNSLVHSVPGFIVKQRGPIITFGEPDNGIRGYLDHKKRTFKKDIVIHSYVIVK